MPSLRVSLGASSRGCHKGSSRFRFEGLGLRV